jgi:hypothetical protein
MVTIIIVADSNLMHRISRRKFTQIISAAGVTGAVLVETMYAEMQDSGAISRESVRAFLALSGTKPPNDQLVSVQASLERALDSLKKVRDREVAQNVGPAVMFRVRR